MSGRGERISPPFKIGRLVARRPKSPLGDDAPVGAFVHGSDLRLAVGDELFGLCFGEECHD
jgi:hypothetical protein